VTQLKISNVSPRTEVHEARRVTRRGDPTYTGVGN
jgi:sulfatase maturation enzyme AslB (radical SAM superfamily)